MTVVNSPLSGPILLRLAACSTHERQVEILHAESVHAHQKVRG
jgi:hypothetical protein